MLHTHEVRRKFLDYFKHQSHAIIASSPVVPHEDPSLLFINAGMNQFKDVFLGKTVRDYKRAVTSQKCIRVGGKHNDLDNVGHTRRHLTFFEMLGNFSFGDYFKDKAIQFSWEVTTNIFKFDPDKLWASIFENDDESHELWLKYLPENRIVRMGEKDNFWLMGDVGPCGPCSELLYDRGALYGAASTPLEDPHGDRFLEFWNLVFMQYNRSSEGALNPLPKPSIDTGAGLERVMCLIQDKDNVFDTDVLRSLIAKIEEMSGTSYDPEQHMQAAAFRVIADHMRCLSFAIADGAQPSNVERGYVLRKVLRRSVRYGKLLGFDRPFLAQVLDRLIEVMGRDFRELIISKDRIAEIVTLEEESFFRTLRRGGNILNQIIESSKAHQSEILAQDAFKLKDTYGLPLEEIELIAKDYDLHVDIDGFKLLEKEAKERSKASKRVIQEHVQETLYEDFVTRFGECQFIRDPKAEPQAKVLGIITDGALCSAISEGQEGMLILDETSFYAEMGGQVGDTGELTSEAACFSVSNCMSPFKGIIAHVGKVTCGQICTGDYVETHIDRGRRQKIANNHTATHLLHWALHQVLGEHTKQAGSVVDPGRLRFDFSHHKAVSDEEIEAIELLVNEKIRQNIPIGSYELSYDEAQKRSDIKQFFGDKYGAIVRVVDIGASKELCGGTHTSHTGNIGYFRVQKESSISAGVRRIEAVTGAEAEQFSYQKDSLINKLAAIFKIAPAKLHDRVEKTQEEIKALQNQLKTLQKERLSSIAQNLPRAVSPAGIHYCVSEVPVQVSELRMLLDELKMPSGVVGIACKDAEKVHFVIKVSKDLVSKGVQASSLLQSVLAIIEGNGGGKADNAQGAGKAPQKLDNALDDLKKRLSNECFA